MRSSLCRREMYVCIRCIAYYKKVRSLQRGSPIRRDIYRPAARCRRTQRLPESHSMSIELLDAALIAVPDGFVSFGMRKLTAR